MSTDAVAPTTPLTAEALTPPAAGLPEAAPPARAGRVLPELAELPAGALLDESALAAALGVTARSIRRAVRRGELPPGVLLGGRKQWIAGRVLTWLEARAAKAEEAAEREAQRLARLPNVL